MLARIFMVSVSFFMISGFCVSINAEGLEKQTEALNVIADFADRMCNKVPNTGKTQNLELSGSAKADLNALLKKIADLGIDGAAKYQKTEYENVLQKDLAGLLKDSSKCKLEVLKTLEAKLLAPSKEVTNLAQPKEVTNTVNVSVIKGKATANLKSDKNNSDTKNEVNIEEISETGEATLNLGG